MYGLEPITLIPEGAYTSTQTSQTFTNPGHQGIQMHLKVTVASGTGGLRPQVRVHSPDGNAVVISPIPLRVTTTGDFIYLHHPAAADASTFLRVCSKIPLAAGRFSVTVNHADGSSYTYSLTGWLLP